MTPAERGGERPYDVTLQLGATGPSVTTRVYATDEDDARERAEDLLVYCSDIVPVKEEREP